MEKTELGTSGHLWAEAFLLAYSLGSDTFLNLDNVTGWFAAAIEAGRASEAGQASALPWYDKE